MKRCRVHGNQRLKLIRSGEVYEADDLDGLGSPSPPCALSFPRSFLLSKSIESALRFPTKTLGSRSPPDRFPSREDSRLTQARAEVNSRVRKGTGIDTTSVGREEDFKRKSVLVVVSARRLGLASVSVTFRLQILPSRRTLVLPCISQLDPQPRERRPPHPSHWVLLGVQGQEAGRE